MPTKSEQKSQLTPPVPESCIWLNPVILLSSLAYPPCSSPPLVSATALAIENGKLAPAKTWPPLIVPMRGSTKSRMLVEFCALVGEMLENSSVASEAREMRGERAMAAKRQHCEAQPRLQMSRTESEWITLEKRREVMSRYHLVYYLVAWKVTHRPARMWVYVRTCSKPQL